MKQIELKTNRTAASPTLTESSLEESIAQTVKAIKALQYQEYDRWQQIYRFTYFYDQYKPKKKPKPRKVKQQCTKTKPPKIYPTLLSLDVLKASQRI